MKFWFFILLLELCFSDWTTAEERHYRHYSRVRSGTLIRALRTNSTHIDLSDSGLEHIGNTAFNHLTLIKSLDLSYNRLTSLGPSIFSELSHLEYLSLSHNKFSSFYHVFHGLKNLKHLDISFNPISHLKRSDLYGLPVSATVYVGADKIFPSSPVTVPFDYEKSRQRDFQPPNTFESEWYENREIKICKTVGGLVQSVEELKLNEPLGHCIKVKIILASSILDLSNRSLRKFSHNWYKLQDNHITTLRLYNNEISVITSELLNDLPSNIYYIDLRYNNIKILKKYMINNSNIRIMHLDYNLISTIEDGAFENTKLTSLLIQGNRLNDLTFLETVPATIEHLWLSQNSFPVISSNTFQHLKNLKELILFECRIEMIESGAFEYHEKLNIIHLAFNRIGELKPGIFIGMPVLEVVDLSFNRIEKISRGIFSRIGDSKIHEIRLDHNQIDTIEAGSFSNLSITKMNLEMNQITEESVTKDVFESSIINDLHLGDNLISEINESFLDIPTLINLNLTRNHIRSIKVGAIKDMPYLKDLDLSQNPLNHLEIDALYRLSFDYVTVNLFRVPLQSFKAGVFGYICYACYT